MAERIAQHPETGAGQGRLPTVLRYLAAACLAGGLVAAAALLPAGSLGSATAVCAVEDTDWQLVDLPPLECESMAAPPSFEAFVPSIAFAVLGFVAALESAAAAMAITLFREARLYRRVARGDAPRSSLLPPHATVRRRRHWAFQAVRRIPRGNDDAVARRVTPIR
jgi:hypothetical protein